MPSSLPCFYHVLTYKTLLLQYGPRYGSGQNYDEQGEDAPDDDYPENGCGGFGGEYFWYMGRTQCFKANVAYSLYGVLTTDSDRLQNARNHCTKRTYINSFFTTYGPESFTGPLGLGVDTINSYCNIGDKPDSLYANADDVAADDDYLDDGYLFYDYKSFTSYGTGCARDGSFVTDSYNGAFCHGKNQKKTLDRLKSFNSQLRSMKCTQIYDGSGEVYDFEGDGNNDDADDDGGGGDGGGYNFANMDAVNLLAFSKSCSLRQYPNDCPDPFDIKRTYANRVQRAFWFRSPGSRHARVQNLLRAAASLLVVGGLVALLMTYEMIQKVKEADKKTVPGRVRSGFRCFSRLFGRK